MRRGVVLAGFRRVVRSMCVVPVRHKRVVTRLLVITCIVMFCRFAVVPCRALVMVGRASMMIGTVMGCHSRLLEWDA